MDGIQGALQLLYLPRTTSIPEKTSSSLARGSLPTRSVRRSLSRVTIWETLATESLESPVMRAGRETFPGAAAHFMLLVSGTQTAVAMRLRFKASLCTTTTGLRNPGPDPVGAGNPPTKFRLVRLPLAFLLWCAGRRWKRTHPFCHRFGRRPGSSPRSLHRAHDAPVYSFRASLNNWLRDFLLLRASRSAPSKISSGIETAVFIPLSITGRPGAIKPADRLPGEPHHHAL